MDSAALDPRLRSTHDSSSISVHVAEDASLPSSSPSLAPPVSHNNVSAPTPTPTASGPGSGTGTQHFNGSVSGTVAAGALYSAAPAASAASTHTPGNAPSPFPTATAYPQPPAAPSTTNALPDDHTGDQDNSGSDPRKARACEACRGLKVRCETVPEDPEGACKRCAKAGRNCVITQPTRKRQKKTDNRVAELEKKIDALTATLSAAKAGQPSQPGTSVSTHPEAGPPGGWDADGTGISASAVPPVAKAGQKRKRSAPVANGGHTPASSSSNEHHDLVARGIITADSAAHLLDRYNYQMAPHLPGVVFPPHLTADELRKTRPVLFLAVMAVASSSLPEVKRVAFRELFQAFADSILIKGEKSIELVQALTLAAMWYLPPENLDELKFYQLVHMAMIMALDLGLGRGRPRGSKPTAWGAQPPRRQVQPDPTTIEARRTWLLCYYMTVNTAMALHRPFLLRWTSFMAECMDILESSPEAAPTDKYFCHLVWTHRLAEEIGFQFCMDDPSVPVSLSDHMTQHRIRGFERELDKHKNQVPVELLHPSLRLSFHTLSLYMHELALQTDPADAIKSPFVPESAAGNATLNPAYTSALAACLTAIDGIFDTFLSMDPSSINCMPVFNLVRVSYAMVILIKIYSAASNPSSDLGKVIDKDSLKVEQKLSDLVEKYRAVSNIDKHHPASNFLTIAVMVRAWFLKFSQSQPRRGETKTDGSTNAAGPNQAGDSSQASSNPLQLLSEAATNNRAATGVSEVQAPADGAPQSGNGDADASTAGAVSSSNGPGANQERKDDGSINMPPPPMPQAQAYPHQHGFVGGTPAPWLGFGTDFDAHILADGFTQAWDLTMEGLGDGQGGFQDFNGFMLGVPDPLFDPAGTQMPGPGSF
ncbi:hypothetical protein KVR01_005545 [Diaporthe batatas]|uniref:uncharacterized protein n=1 Tax=Diaporthe batatas TaxID=748121 RepID=UPI001D03DA2A|nr:uncharacterized protein KVR01_005545 [Diaporthe batatas]KAG8165270.1 hypothetical protein KVR01_005545 [Diaporthe batatas]